MHLVNDFIFYHFHSYLMLPSGFMSIRHICPEREQIRLCKINVDLFHNDGQGD